MAEANPNSRLEMFCDGVFAIAITLLIIEIKVPPLNMMHSLADVWKGIAQLWPSAFAMLLSFVIIFFSWYGHHALLKGLDKTSTRFQFANGFFLFTIVVIPFPTAFMAEYLTTPYAQAAIVFYCLCSLLHNLGWRVLVRSIVKPKQLAKSPEHIKFVNGIIKGNQYGTIINLTITTLAWWLPYVALILSILLWAYWLYIALAAKHES